MKKLNIGAMTLIQQGKPWPFSVMPNSKDMLRYLEKNESVVTWFQPRAGLVSDQVPAIRVGKDYFTLSLRMMKAIWRHVRLKKEFQNFENSPYGGLKLRIPVELFNEKIRTQSRFHVGGKVSPLCFFFSVHMRAKPHLFALTLLLINTTPLPGFHRLRRHVRAEGGSLPAAVDPHGKALPVHRVLPD